MKPLKGEIVNGTDTSGRPFSDAIVTGHGPGYSTVRRLDGQQVAASNQNIKGAAEPKKKD